MKRLLCVPHVSESLRNSLSSEKFRCLVRNQSGGEVEMLVYDDIGEPGTTSSAKGVAAFLASNRSKPVHVRVNSVGGLAYDGLTIFNSLASHDGFVTITIEGIAASAAGIISLAGDKVRQYENASSMFHRAWGVTIGNVDDMAAAGKWLAELDQQIAVTMASRTGKSAAAMLAIMKGVDGADGTTFTAHDALKAKLIDEVVPIGGKSKNARQPFDIEQARRDAKNAIAARRIREITAAHT